MESLHLFRQDRRLTQELTPPRKLVAEMNCLICAGADKQEASDRPRISTTGQKRKRSAFEDELLRITVECDDEQRNYHVHQDLLYEQSHYFSALSKFKEGEEAHVTLRNMNQKAFENIIHWVYKGVLDPKLSTSAEDLIRTWTAADYLMMGRCKNIVIDELRRLSAKRQITTEDLILVDKLGHHMSSTLAQCVIDLIAYDRALVSEDLFEEAELEFMPVHVVCALMNGINFAPRDLYRYDDLFRVTECMYHKHDAGEKCYLEEEDQEEVEE